MSEPELRLRVCTLNCWFALYVVSAIIISHNNPRGLKYVAKDRKERIAAIANELAKSNYDIVTLQELWVFADYEHVRASISNRLPYAKFFYRWVLLYEGAEGH